MLPHLVTAIPGPRSQELAARLKAVECRNTTFVSPDWPIFWERAYGTNVWDADGNRFLDLTSAFGVATLGHGFAAESIASQSQKLLHAMGDVHPATLKVELCEKLSDLTYGRWTGGKGKTLLGNSGFEAVEAALKTAVLATRRSGILSFENAYHGLGYGALLGAGIPWFREPFEPQLAKVTRRLPYPSSADDLGKFRDALSAIDGNSIAAVLVEPMQGRGGIVIPPPEFLTELRHWCDQHGALLIADEIYTGLNRTGKLFGCDWSGVVPDLICLGKALSGGFPISACVGKSEIMDAWPETHGEALHTSTFLGNPLGCAMAIASLEKHANSETSTLSETAGALFHKHLKTLTSPFITDVRGTGMMRAIELRHPDGRPAGDIAIATVIDLLKQGIIVLPDAPEGHVIAFTPPITLSEEEMILATGAISSALERSSDIPV